MTRRESPGGENPSPARSALPLAMLHQGRREIYAPDLEALLLQEQAITPFTCPNFQQSRFCLLLKEAQEVLAHLQFPWRNGGSGAFLYRAIICLAQISNDVVIHQPVSFRRVHMSAPL
jgi:hypothetical protein